MLKWSQIISVNSSVPTSKFIVGTHVPSLFRYHHKSLNRCCWRLDSPDAQSDDGGIGAAGERLLFFLKSTKVRRRLRMLLRERFHSLDRRQLLRSVCDQSDRCLYLPASLSLRLKQI